MFVLSNAIEIAFTAKVYYDSNYNVGEWETMQADYLEQQWAFRGNMRSLLSGAAFLNAMAWFFFCAPILQVAWILSGGGKRSTGLHGFIAVMALGGTLIELLAKLMVLGREQAAAFLKGSFNLQNWISSSNGFDNIGLRVLEMAYMMTVGLTMWIDAFEWFAIFCIMLLIYSSLRGAPEQYFSPAWAAFGMVIGSLSLVTLSSSVLQIKNYTLFHDISLLISICNTIFFLPVWLIWLSIQLPKSQPQYSEENDTFL